MPVTPEYDKLFKDIYFVIKKGYPIDFIPDFNRFCETIH